MKASQELIDGLRKAAQLVLTDEYDWNYHSSCNCGMLARALGLPPLKMMRSCWTGNWTDTFAKWLMELDNKCSYLDRDLDEVFQFLLNKGIEQQDIQRIEFLEIQFLPKVDFKKPQHVAEWFLAQADKLEQELKASEVQPEPERVHVHDTLQG